MNHDDHVALIEIKGQIEKLLTQRRQATIASDWVSVDKLQAHIEDAEAKRIAIIRRTEPEDAPKL
jgi:hypothetical protein